MKATQYILMSQQEMSAAFICPLHSHPYLITALVVNKYEQSAKNGNKGSVKSCKQGEGRKRVDRQMDGEGERGDFREKKQKKKN